MKRKLTAGQTSVSLPIFIQDTSSTTGGGLSGLTSATSGLVAEYRRRGQSSWTTITLTSKTLGTWTSGGFVADGALAGAYELDLPDAVCASGQRWVAVRLRGAANMLPCLIEIELDVADYQVAALGALTTLGANAPNNWINAAAIAADAITAAKIADGAIDTATFAAGTTLPRVTLVDTCTTNTDMRGTDNAAPAATALSTAVWTSTIAGRIDAAISSRSTYAGADTAGTTTLLSRIGSAITITGGAVAAVLDSASVTAVQSGLALEATSQSIKTKTDNLPTDPADQSLIIAATDAVMARLGAPAGASMSADVAAVKSDTANLLSRVTTNAATAIQNLWHMITGTGASSKFTVAALENGPAGAGGSGDWTDTEKEQIRYRLGLDGETSAPADPDTDPIVVTPGSGDLTTGYTTTLGTDGQAIEGIFVRWRLVDVPTGTGLALDSSASEAQSDSNGLVQLAGLVKGATYLIWRGTNERDGITVTIPTDASSTYELPNIAGP